MCLWWLAKCILDKFVFFVWKVWFNVAIRKKKKANRKLNITNLKGKTVPGNYCVTNCENEALPKYAIRTSLYLLLQKQSQYVKLQQILKWLCLSIHQIPSQNVNWKSWFQKTTVHIHLSTTIHDQNQAQLCHWHKQKRASSSCKTAAPP